MKKLLTTLLFGSIFSACAERQPVPAIPSDPEIEGKIEKLLKGMTLEEKISPVNLIQTINAWNPDFFQRFLLNLCDHFCKHFLFLARHDS